MAYYWVTEAQKYIQSLGFGTALRPINMESQDIRINQWGVDNSYSWDKHDVLRFGKGGVDDVVAPTPDPACIADWDSVSYTANEPHCLRRVDLDLHYPEDLRGRIHFDGQIWSRALWDIRAALGHRMADTIILEAQFDFAADTSMSDATQATVDAAARLYNRGIANKVRVAFTDRGIF